MSNLPNFTLMEYEIIDNDEKTLVLKYPELSEDEIIFKNIIKDKAIKSFQDISITSEKAREYVKNKILNLIVDKLQSNKHNLNIDVEDVEKIKFLAEIIMREMYGYGLLDYLLEDDDLEEIMVIGVNLPVYVVHRKHGMLKTNIVYTDEKEIRNIIEKMARSSGRWIDMANPLLDSRLPDGSRLNATLSPPSLDGPTLTIRKFKKEALTIVDLINFRTLTSELAAFLWIAVEGFGVKPSNILIAGGTGSGKTTTLNCLCTFIPKRNRVITIEDTAELQLPVTHKVRLETKLPSAEGKGGITFNQLLINTLRMRPDRIILGEVRGEEAETLFVAMNTGHDGCMGTLHANTAQETIVRLTNPPMNVPVIMIPALDLIIMQNRFYKEGKTLRRITEVAEVAGLEMDRVLLNKIYEYDAKEDTIKSTGTPPTLYQKLAESTSLSKSDILKELERRKFVLEFLVYKNLRSLNDVYTWIQKYYKSPDETFEEIEKMLKSS